MIDRLFLATLTFCVSIVGALAIAASLLGFDVRTAAQKAASNPVRIVQLERVVVTARRVIPGTRVAQSEATVEIR